MPNIFEDYHYFKWSDLFDFHEETEIGIEAFQILCSNQEDFILLAQKKFEENIRADSDLNNIEPENYGGYYRSVFKRQWFVKKCPVAV